MTRVRLERLLRAVDMVVQERAATLADVRRRSAGVQAERAELLRTASAAGHAERAMAAVPPWHVWRDRRLEELSVKEAQLKVELETARLEGARALGRREVIRRIQERHVGTPLTRLPGE